MVTRTKCSECNDTGWITRPGENYPARCECVARAALERMVLNANIPERFAKCTLRSFDVGRRSSATDAFLTVSKWAVAYPDVSQRGILLAGPPNSGKTHIAVAAIRELMARLTPASFQDYPALLESIKASYDGKGDVRPYQKALATPMLLLDDLGAHRLTDWVEDTIAGIITHRLNQNLGLIATTNLTASGASSRENGRLVVHETLEDRIGRQAHAKLLQLCQVVRIV